MTILLACCLFWGFQQVLVKATIPDVPRCCPSCVLRALADPVGVVRVAWHSSVRAMARLAAGMLAGALFAAGIACLFAGLQYTTASRLTVFVYTSPLWVAAIVP